MATQFYLTLPSNSKTDNTAAVFSTALPININLEGEWEVGLAEIIYANTWHNLAANQNVIKFFDVKNIGQKSIKIPPARYHNIEELVNVIKQAISEYSTKMKYDYTTIFDFHYDQFKKITEIKIYYPEVLKNIKISKHLMYMLGFSEDQFHSINYNDDKVIVAAKHPPDMFGGLHCFYIYCDILQPQIVGNSLSPLLQVVNVEGQYMQIVSRTYTSPHFIPVLKKSFNTIEINIKDDLDVPVQFQFGKTIVKLHFRKL